MDAEDSHANEMLKRGDASSARSSRSTKSGKRIALGLKQLAGDPWETTIPEKYQPGTVVTGKVTKITNFGVFVELEPELEGLCTSPNWPTTRSIIRKRSSKSARRSKSACCVSIAPERKIGLSRRAPTAEGAEVTDEAAQGRGTATPREELKGGTGSGQAGPLFTMGAPTSDSEPPAEDAATP